MVPLVIDQVSIVQPMVLNRPKRVGQVVDELGRRGDVEARRQVLGIELDRRQVEPHLGLEREQAERADAVRP